MTSREFCTKILSFELLGPGEYALLDAGYFEQREAGETLDMPGLVLSELDDGEGSYFERFSEGNPRRNDSNFRIWVLRGELTVGVGELIGDFDGSTYYDVDGKFRDNFRRIRHLFASYRPDDALLDEFGCAIR